jgi:hypothetical protein
MVLRRLGFYGGLQAQRTATGRRRAKRRLQPFFHHRSFKIARDHQDNSIDPIEVPIEIPQIVATHSRDRLNGSDHRAAEMFISK